MAKVKFEITARDKSKATLNRFKARIARVKNSVFSLRGGVAALAGAAGLGLLVKRSFETNDALAKTADKLGITTQALAGLQLAADLTGVAQTTLTKALTKQQKAIFDASRGLLTYKQHFDALGLSTKALKEQSPDEQFKTIAEAMNKLENQTLKTAIAYDLFGGRGTALLNTIALGRDGLEAVKAEADALGLAISRVDAAKIEQANDSFTRLKSVAKGVGNAISSNIAPVITALATQLVNTAKEAGGMSNFVSAAMQKIIASVGFAADMVRGLQVVWKGLQVIALGAISAILTGLDELNRAGATALNWIPGINIKPSSALSEWAGESRNALIFTIEEMERLANLPMPSTGVEQWAKDIQYQAQVAAEEIAKTKAAMTGGGAGGTGATSTAGEDAATAKQAAALSKSIDQVQQSLLTEEQRISESYDRRSFMVEDAFQNQIISEQYKNELLQGLEQQNQDKLLAIVASAEQKKRAMFSAGLGAAANIFTNLSALMGKEGAKMNAKQKLLARAGIIASTAQAVMNALAVPPYPLGLSLAAGAALQGANQLRKVGGGGSVGAPVASPISQAGQSQPIPPQQLQGQQQSVVVNINGTVLGADIETIIADAVRSGVNSENIIIEVNGERAVVN